MTRAHLYSLARPLLFRLDPEAAHDVALPAFKRLAVFGAGALIGLPGRPIDGPRVRVMGLDFPNPIGLAAGFDKNAAFIDVFGRFGFGFLEVGTVTPRPQPGNPKPRLFRIPEAQALVNRMGFNNEGLDRFVTNVRAARFDGVLGINVGKNFDTPLERAADDYVACIERVYPYAGYLVVNISSPNTKNLRQLQSGEELGPLLAKVMKARDRQARATKRRVPLAVKIAPDLDDAAIEMIATTLVEHGVDAAVATNTTVSRAGVKGLPHAEETGGLSGAPLRAMSTRVVRKLVRALDGRMPVMGVGGILSGEDAREKIDAGASLVQIYTGLVYRGPELVREITTTLASRSVRGRAAA
jgi:dihydroorotate dehydrogenase